MIKNQRTFHRLFSVLFSALLSPLLSTVVFCGLALSVMLTSSKAHAESDDFRMTFDVSGSIGKTYDRSYQEISLGVNAYFTDWFAWRNSGFARFIEGVDNVYGLDTSARFILNLGDSTLGFTAFVGPGYRFATSSGTLPADSAPFAEGGVVAKLGGLSIGGGVKTVFNSLVRSGAPEDTQYFLILAGGGSL